MGLRPLRDGSPHYQQRPKLVLDLWTRAACAKQIGARVKPIFALLMMAFLCTLAETSSADVGRPADTKSEDIAGAAVIGANLVIAAQIGRYLQHEHPSRTWGWLGVGVGTASIALGATETTSFSGAVVAAGAVAAVLGAIQLARHGDMAEHHGSGDISSRSISFCPLVTSSEKSGCGIGILAQLAF